MRDDLPPPAASREAGHEVRDLSIPLVVTVALMLVLVGVGLLVFLWGLSRMMVPEEGKDGASPPVVMPGEPPVGDRVRVIPEPRLDPLDPSPDQYPEDLRADRQPRLQGYGWVEPGTVARIPIDRAMNVVVERANAAAKKEGAK